MRAGGVRLRVGVATRPYGRRRRKVCLMSRRCWGGRWRLRRPGLRRRRGRDRSWLGMGVAVRRRDDAHRQPLDQEHGRAVQSGGVARHRHRDHHRTHRPQRRKQREPGEHAEGGKDWMAPNVRWRGGSGRCGRRTAVSDGHVTRLCDSAGQVADQTPNSGLTSLFRCRYHAVTLPWTGSPRCRDTIERPVLGG
jgi:hypothetical protein